MLIAVILLALILSPYVIKTYNKSTVLHETVRAALGDMVSAKESRAAIFQMATEQITNGDTYEVAFQKAILSMRAGTLAKQTQTSAAGSMLAVAESYPAPASIQLRRDFGGTIQEVEFALQAKVERCNAAIEAYNTFVTAIPEIIVLFPLGRRRLEFIASTSKDDGEKVS